VDHNIWHPQVKGTGQMDGQRPMLTAAT